MMERLRQLIVTYTPSGSLRDRAIQSGIWAIVINILDRGVQIAKLIFLTYFLTPSDFGIVGIGLLVVVSTRQLSKLGLDKSLIRRSQENVDMYLNTLWTVKVIRGIAILILVVLIAPYISQFFNEPSSVPYIRVLGLSPLIIGLQNPSILYFQKDLEFNKEFIYRLSGTFADALIAIILGAIFKTPWALVAGLLLRNSVRTVVSYLISNHRPGVEMNWEYAKEMFGFGKWITGTSILSYATNRGDDVLVGWLFGSSGLGIYQLSYRISNAPATEISEVITNVALPAFSKAKEQTDKLQRGYLLIVQTVSFIVFPTTIGILIVSESFVRGILGNQWASATLPLQVLALLGLTRAISSVNTPVLESLNRPDYRMKIQIIKTIVLSLIIYPLAIRYNIAGVALASLLAALISMAITTYVTLDLASISLYRTLKQLVYPLTASIVMGGVVLLVQAISEPVPVVLEFFISVLSGILAYLCTVFVMTRLFDYRILESFVTIRNTVRD